MPGSLTVASLTDSFDDREPVTPRTEEDITTRLGDADLMTDDEDVSRVRSQRGFGTDSIRCAHRSGTGGDQGHLRRQDGLSRGRSL